MTGQVEVRPGTMSDARLLARLSGELGYPTAEGEVKRRLARILSDPEQAVFVAKGPEATILGWVHVQARHFVECDSFAEIGGLVVGAQYRRGGVGSRLMGEAERWAIGKGFCAVRLRSRTERKEAHRFYERIGYQRVKQQEVFQRVLAGPELSLA